MEVDDVFQLGVFGLIKAMQSFDIDKGNKFSSFGCTAIERTIKDHMRDKSRIVRIPRAVSGLYYKIREIISKEDAELVSKDIVEILKNEYDIKSNVNKVEWALRHGVRIKYLDESNISDESSEHIPLMESLPDPFNVEADTVDRIYIRDLIKRICVQLNEEELDILRLMLDESDITKKDIGIITNIPQYRVTKHVKNIRNLIADEMYLDELI